MKSAAVLLLVFLAACGGEAAPQADRSTVAPLAPPWTSPPAQALVEDCSDCHREQANGWAQSGMSRSLGVVSNEEVAALGGLYDEASGYRYDFLTTPGGPGILETHPNHPRHQRGAPLVLAVGSGSMDRSYVAQEGSLLWFAPLETVTLAEGRRAQLAPSHAIEPGKRFDVAITGECLGCHTDSLPKRDYPLNVRPQGWQPQGISCAACHAGARGHAVHREAELGGEGSKGPDPLLSLKGLSRYERLSVCAACHLQGDARIVLEPGQLGPPEPGGDLLEQRALFVAREPSEEIGFVSQVERLVLSPCFTSSEMVCATCHDPHRSLSQAEEAERVRAACLTCHAADDAPEPACSRDVRPNDADCVTCHMPLRATFDVETVRIHDHWIRRRPAQNPPPPEPLRFAESPSGDWKRFTWPGAEPPDHVDDPGLWMMAFHWSGHAARAEERVDHPVGPAVAKLPMYHHVRGVVLERLQRREEAQAAYRRALELDPGEGASTLNLALLLAQGDAGQRTEALGLLNETLQRYPRFEGALRNRALLQHKQGRVPEVLRDLERAFDLKPTAPLAKTLGGLYGSLGDRERERHWLQTSQALTPDLVPADG